MIVLLEEVCKHLTCIEQASLQRISEFKAQVIIFGFAVFLYLTGDYLNSEKACSCSVWPTARPNANLLKSRGIYYILRTVVNAWCKSIGFVTQGFMFCFKSGHFMQN